MSASSSGQPIQDIAKAIVVGDGRVENIVLRSCGVNSIETRSTELDDVVLDGATGLVHKNRVAYLESGYDIDRLSRSPLYRVPSPRYEVLGKSLDHAFSLHHWPWAKQNLYHLLVDVVPRVADPEVIRGLGNYIAVLPKRPWPVFDWFIRQALGDRLIDQAALVAPHEQIRIKRYLLLPFRSASQNGTVPHSVLEWYREISRKADNGNGEDLVYIERNPETVRSMADGESVRKMLEKHGFRTIRMSQLTIEQQLSRVCRAKIIVSPHGAGLTHALFSQAKSIVEIQDTNRLRPHYVWLSTSLGANHILCHSAMDSEGRYLPAIADLEHAIKISKTFL